MLVSFGKTEVIVIQEKGTTLVILTKCLLSDLGKQAQREHWSHTNNNYRKQLLPSALEELISDAPAVSSRWKGGLSSPTRSLIARAEASSSGPKPSPCLTWQEIVLTRRQKEKSKVKCLLEERCGNSLVVQWLRLCAPSAGGLGSILGQGTRSCMLQLRVHTPQLKILHEDQVQPNKDFKVIYF